MELRHLRYFIAVAEALSFSRAATRLRLSQPSLSTQIRDLETELHVKLLERDRSNVSLTDAGTVFLKEARSVLARAEKAVARAREAAAGITGELRIATVDLLTIKFLPGSLTRLHSSTPTAKVHVQERAPSEQLPLLQAGKIHVGFVPMHFARLAAGRGLGKVGIIHCPLAVMMSASNPLAKKPGLHLLELADSTFIHITMFGSDAQRMWTEEICESMGFVARIGTSATTVDNLMSLVSAGAGVMLIPIVAQRPETPGVVVVPLLDKGLDYELHMMYNQKFPSDLRDTFMEIVKEEVIKLGPEYSPLAEGAPSATARAKSNHKRGHNGHENGSGGGNENHARTSKARK
ncbi:LysR family transcriptional regulator [Roseimicrobium gellanilyticum]|uniref:LysR family transcriptional regulator n=1 Tax=Roseimicrobium gellanilyticum TaxID=748857 RepID=A0A366HIH5_9BACT|nr:LysR family transcriptional regulator [Roseimicrobium gellanilyticum]RBP42462.1 LysR family transcriptional regulator [Roseimicrobium gellanilyticum]